MKVIFAVAALVAVASAASLSLEDLEFHAWKLKFGKSYGSEEEESRRKMVWMDNRKLILEHNLLADQGIKSYRLGLNQFSDLDNQEYQAMFLGCLQTYDISENQTATPFHEPAGDAALSSSVDWREKGYVTAVKNQRHCGSCWAFSATGALEGQMFKTTGQLVSLSEQQLVDCSSEFGNHGCNGGLAYKAFKYIISNRGLESEASYPYKAREGRCKFNSNSVVAKCSDFVLMTNGNEETLQKTVASVGPVSASIDVSHRSFQHYKSGVYDEPECSSTRLGHAILIVGYGTEDSKDYWLVKNSWGTDWGDNGYIKMSRNKRNQCGIATRPTYPVV